MRILFTFTLTLFTICCASAQLEKVLHQTFELGEAERINLDLKGEYKIELWAGNTVMTETQIRLTDASPAILKHFIEKAKRYDVVLENENSTARFYSHDKERREIKSKYGLCYEEVNLRIFVPDSFEIINEKSLVKKARESDD